MGGGGGWNETVTNNIYEKVGLETGGDECTLLLYFIITFITVFIEESARVEQIEVCLLRLYN